MAIIYSYPEVTSLQVTDRFIISRFPASSGDISNYSLDVDTLATFITARVNLNFLGDAGTGIINLDTQNLTVSGTANEIETSASSQTLQIGLPDNVTITNNLTIGGNAEVTGNTTNTGDVQIDTLTNNYIPVNNNQGVLRDSGFYQAFLPGVPIDGAIGLNTTKLDSVFGERPDMRIASRQTNDPGVLDLFRPDGDVLGGDKVGVLHYSLDDDSQYTVAQIEVKTIGDSGSYNGGGGKLYFKTSTNVTSASPAERLSIDDTEADFSVPIKVTTTNKSSFAGQVTIPLNPVSATDAASKAYVDAQNQGQVTGTGTPNTIAMFTPDGTTIGDSPITKTGFSDIQIAGSVILPQFSYLYWGSNNSDRLSIQNNIAGSDIRQTGSGALRIQCDSEVSISASASVGGTEALAKFKENGPIELYYDNVKKFETTNNTIKISGVPVHADNAAATTAGLTVGEVYRTGDLLKIVH